MEQEEKAKSISGKELTHDILHERIFDLEFELAIKNGEGGQDFWELQDEFHETIGQDPEYRKKNDLLEIMPTELRIYDRSILDSAFAFLSSQPTLTGETIDKYLNGYCKLNYETQVREKLAAILNVKLEKLEKTNLHGFIVAYKEKDLTPDEAAQNIFKHAGAEIKKNLAREKKLNRKLGL